MGEKNLENIISNIGQEELAVAQKQAQIDRLKQLILKQKKEMAEQQKIIDEFFNGKPLQVGYFYNRQAQRKTHCGTIAREQQRLT